MNKEYPVPGVTEQASSETNRIITDWETSDEGIKRETETTRGRRRVLDWRLQRLLRGGDIFVNPEGKGGANEFKIWRKSIPGRGTTRAKALR